MNWNKRLEIVGAKYHACHNLFKVRRRGRKKSKVKKLTRKEKKNRKLFFLNKFFEKFKEPLDFN